MKTFLFSAAALLLCASSAFAAGAKIEVPAANCEHCVLALTDEFEANDAVKGVKVDIKSRTLTLEFKEGKSLDDKAIKDGVKNAGFDAGKIERM